MQASNGCLHSQAMKENMTDIKYIFYMTVNLISEALLLIYDSYQSDNHK